MKIQWKEEYNTNIKLIDEQHFRFIMELNSLFDKKIFSEKEMLIKKFNAIYKEIEIHFTTEEKFMHDYKFSGYFSHKSEHDRFKRNFLEQISQIDNGKMDNLEKMVFSISNWFVNHLEINDKKLAKYLNSINVY